MYIKLAEVPFLVKPDRRPYEKFRVSTDGKLAEMISRRAILSYVLIFFLHRP